MKNRENWPFSVFGKVARFYSELSVEIASKADFPSLEIVDVYVSTVSMGSNNISISTDGYSTRSVDWQWLKVLPEFLKNLESDRNWLFSKILGQFQELYAHGGNNDDYFPGARSGKIFTIISRSSY